ncbi:RHS repeat-associated core domain-containing protein [uncultured Amnibacterium sp.]|uniref:RHS repeat-associated core domain-containing protein n=1 Tax=uncultured Amnibacterium sp. TaxID=1631851 RepID=UPI0035CB3FED
MAVLLSGALAAPADAAVVSPAAEAVGRAKPLQPDSNHYTGLSAARKAALEAAARAQPTPSGKRVEDRALRTANSSTVVDPSSGTRITRISPQPLNVRDAAGKWQPVDTELVPATGSTWRTVSTGYEVAVPKVLNEPVRLVDGQDPSRWVSMELVAEGSEPSGSATVAPSSARVGARPEESVGSADGDTVTFEDALPGSDLALLATPTGLKETVTLASRDSRSSWSYRLKVADGLTVTESHDVIRVRDAGKTVFVLPAPFMDDAHGAHSDAVAVELAKADGTSDRLVTVTPSKAWLSAEQRVWPVVVDPTIEFPASIIGCAISGSSPSTSACGSLPIPLSWDSSTGEQERGLLFYPDLFDVIPADAQIAQAQLKVEVTPVSGTATTSVDVRELSRYFRQGATWTDNGDGVSWSTPGGDRGPAVARTTVDPATGGDVTFDVAATVQRWIEGTSDYNGFELEKTEAETGGAPVRLTSEDQTSLSIEWNPRAGVRKGNTAVVSTDLDDATSVRVNPATGNAQVTTRQLRIAGLGLDLDVSHTSNSVTSAALGVYGKRWVDSLSGVGLQPYRGSLFYRDGSGADWTFYRALDGAWIRPTGLDADLVDNGNGTYTLTERRSKVEQTFTDIGVAGDAYFGLSKVKDRNGNEITFTYDASARLPYNDRLVLRTVTDTRGRDLDIANFGSFNSWSSDVTNRTPTVTVTNSRLVSETNAAGGQTKYEYDADDRVTAITVPEGQRTELTYDGDGRVLTVKRVSSTQGNPTWSFSYGTFDRSNGAPATSTEVTDPNGNVTTYKSDGRGRVGEVTDARGKKRSSTYTPNDDALTTTGATAGAGSTAQTSTNTYDDAGDASAATWNLSSSRIPTGAGIANTYGSGVRLYDVSTSTDARGTTTDYDYDTAGNQTTVTRGGVTVQNLYQGNTDPDYGGTVDCGPTVSGTVTATKPGVLCETRDGAYVVGSSAAATTAHRTAYRYDELGQLTTMLPGTPSAQQEQTYEYDDLSRLTQTTDGRGQTTIYGYDAMDRLTYTLYSDGRVVSKSFGEERGNGWLRAVEEYPADSESPDRQSSYLRDDLGRLRGTITPEATINLKYDALGRLTEYTDAGGVVKYGYNTANQLTSLALPGGSCSGQSLTTPGAASTKCVLFGVDDDGRRTSTRYPGGQTLATNLDDAGRLQQVVGSTTSGSTSTQRLNLAYTYSDSAAPSSGSNPNKDTGVVTQAVDALTGKTTTYGHDGLDRLTEASTAPTAGGAVTGFEGFCYDGAGNRTKYLNSVSATCSSGSAAATYSYNGGNELTSASGVSPTGSALAGSGFSYDGNGNQTSAMSGVGLATSYGAQNQASSFTPAGGSAIAQSYSAGDGGNGERVKSGTGSGATSFAVTPLSPAPGWSKSGIMSRWTVRDPDGLLIAVRIGANAATAAEYYPFADNVGSVRNLVKADGTVTHSYTYSVFGATLTSSEASGASQPYRYGAGYTDTATGLIKLGIRYYDPAQGRFTQHDPTGQDPHYIYGGNCPSTLNDPTGALSKGVLCGIYGGAAAVGGAVAAGAVAYTVITAGANAVPVVGQANSSAGVVVAAIAGLISAAGGLGLWIAGC